MITCPLIVLKTGIATTQPVRVVSFLCAAAVVIGLGTGCVSRPESAAPVAAASHEADAAFLEADHCLIRNQHGHGDVVSLQGVNLGGWLVWEAWMSPVDTSKALSDLNPGHNGYNFEARQLLTRRFGPAVAEELIDTYKDAWITLTDLDSIQKLGCNTVRLPLAYDTFLQEDGRWRTNAFARVDWLVTNAWQRGLYTILDYHAFLPPGAHQDGSATGYWSNAEQKAETAQLWQRIAEHYRDNPAIAMYDLINEPNNSAPKGRREPSAAVVNDLYAQIYRAIRQVDSRHLIAMEGLWDWKTLRDPQAAGYQNVVYSFHWYYFGTKNPADHLSRTEGDLREIRTMKQRWPVPVLIGEFNHFGDWAAWQHGLNQYREAGLGWTMWSYKNKASGNSSWGVLTTRPKMAPAIPNLATDSAEEIRQKWQGWKTSDQTFALNPQLAPLVRQFCLESRPQLTQANLSAANP